MLAGIGGSTLGFLLFAIWVVVGLGSVAVWIWGLVDAAQRPDWAYTASGSNKVMWIVLIAVLGAIPAIIYLAAIRPKVRDAQAVAPAWGYAAGTWAPPPPGTAFCRTCGMPLAPYAAVCPRCGQGR